MSEDVVDVSYGRKLLGQFWEVEWKQGAVPISWEPFAVAEGQVWYRRKVELWQGPDGSKFTTSSGR